MFTGVFERHFTPLYNYLTRRVGKELAQDLAAETFAQTREIWIAKDGSGRIVEKAGEAAFASETERQEWEAAGRPNLGTDYTSDRNYPAGDTGLSYRDFTGVPTAPDKLYADIQAEAADTGVPVDVEMFVIVGDMLRETFAPPVYRSALYRVAAKIPGVELLGDVTDIPITQTFTAYKASGIVSSVSDRP